MKDFARLFTAVDQTTRTNAKVAAMAEYFRTAPDSDKLWTIALFSGRRPKRAVTTTQLREWAAEKAGLPLWLLEECYPIVGDLAETIALMLPPPRAESDRPLADWIATLRGMARQEIGARRAVIEATWDELGATERFLFNKLMVKIDYFICKIL